MLPPRARGEVSVAVTARDGGTHLKTFRQAGSLKLLFPRSNTARKHGVLVNTAGGITGGDKFRVTAKAGENTRLVLSTQAAERAYRAIKGQTGQLTTELHVASGARLDWLPQETLLFNGSNLQRTLQIDLADTAELLLIEPLIFGRGAMGEAVDNIQFRDRISVTREGHPYFTDAMRFTSDVGAHLDNPHVANGARAIALMVFASPRAEAALPQIREMLPQSAGASLIGDDLVVARILAEDGFYLRQSMIPILNLLTEDDLPRPWMI